MSNRLEIFRQWIKEQGLKATSQREDIAQVFLAANRHISVEELYSEVRHVNPRVGYATVYRTMKLLIECGLAVERHFADGQARFEKVEEERHHDHIICERCGRIIEFVDPQIEQMQAKVARQYGFLATDHKMEIYGICQECREGRESRQTAS
ncbi:MAG: transcriptional repressor [Deltaproteobacteria bacterium]|nr:transcriptional repressor [Deltaproteobacteria bacterium]